MHAGAYFRCPAVAVVIYVIRPVFSKSVFECVGECEWQLLVHGGYAHAELRGLFSAFEEERSYQS